MSKTDFGRGAWTKVANIDMSTPGIGSGSSDYTRTVSPAIARRTVV